MSSARDHNECVIVVGEGFVRNSRRSRKKKPPNLSQRRWNCVKLSPPTTIRISQQLFTPIQRLTRLIISRVINFKSLTISGQAGELIFDYHIDECLSWNIIWLYACIPHRTSSDVSWILYEFIHKGGSRSVDIRLVLAFHEKITICLNGEYNIWSS